MKDHDAQQKYSRRKFLSTLGTASAALLTAPYLKSTNIFAYGSANSTNYLAQVAVTQAVSYDRALIKAKVQHLFESIGGIRDVVKFGNKVAIKINLTGGSGSAYSALLGGKPITESMWTHPEVLRAVCELIIDCGVSGNNIYIVEALWDAESFNNFGYQDVQTSLGAQMVDLNSPAPYSNFIDKAVGPNQSYYSSFKVNQILSDVDVFVSIAKMKQHSEAGVTGAIKNQIGMVPKQLYVTSEKSRRDALHTKDGTVSSTTHLPISICDLCLARPIHLSIIDGIKNARGGEGVWNPAFCVAEDNVLLAGKNPVATDSVMAYLMGNNPDAAKLQLPSGGQCDNYLQLLNQKGIGPNRLSDIEIVGDGAGLVTSVDSKYSVKIPNDFELYQNYPNPFNPSTTFRFHLPSVEFVTINIFNIIGEKIETLIEEEVPQGIHELHWMPKGISSGVYFCEIRAGKFSDRMKMIYQK